MQRYPSSVLVLWLFVSCALPLQLHAGQASVAVSTKSYPSSSEGLRQLLNNMLASAKNGDLEQLRSIIREMEIPDYEAWFPKNFGQERGESWAEPYGRWLTKNEKDFEELMMKLAHMEGEFIVEKMDTEKRYDLFNGPLDSYLARWRVPDAAKGKDLVTLAEFFLVDGKFRWNATVEFFPFQPPAKRSVVPPRVVKKVPPEYPEEAKRNKVEGTVKLQVILRKDGTVAVQNVVEGDPILAPAAIEAVKRWRYEPTQLDGKPVDVQTTIEVNFTLKP